LTRPSSSSFRVVPFVVVSPSAMFQKVVIVDGRGHLLGRLASILAKELLNGQKVVVVRTEEINISGSLFRNKLKYAAFMRVRTNTNPTRGPWHYRAPSRILWRVIRGMTPHKTERAKAALARLKVYEGVPHPFDRMKRVVVPGALRTLRLRPGRKFCRLGDLAAQVGWKHDKLITRLETSRKEKSAAYYKTKLEMAKLKRKAEVNVAGKLTEVEKKLQELGHLLPERVAVEGVEKKKKGAAGAAGATGKKGKAAAADDEE